MPPRWAILPRGAAGGKSHSFIAAELDDSFERSDVTHDPHARQLAVTLASRLPEIARLASLVESFGQQQGLPAPAVLDLNLSLEEVLTNVISYAYDGAGERSIEVRLRVDGGEVSAEIEDEGRAFNPLDVAPPDTSAGLDERKVGGLGIHLVRSVMDSLEYRRERGRNILTMKKRYAAV